ncbi:hypothetical protein [Streptomyces triticisoli]|uniref:hypothetical protein n=1 Tax=Streptomyces triticisoli TaxID=2182797 RepID=UPI000DD4F58F|nr:hypothetical protein [Streptomyces triticisoli]
MAVTVAAAGRTELVQDRHEQREDQRCGQQDAVHAVHQPLFHRVEFLAGADLLQVLPAQCDAAEE